MEGPLKELAKLEKLTTKSSAKGKSSSISDSLDSLLQSLRDAKEAIETGTASSPEMVLEQLAHTIEGRKKDIDERQKEIYSCLSRYGKALDKKFTNSLPTYDPLFTSPSSLEALERTIALHFLRTGQFTTAKTFLEETDVDIPPELYTHFIDLHQIVMALRNHDINPALLWVEKNRSFLESRSSPLEFYLHRSQYIQLLLSSNPLNPLPALSYANATLRPFYNEHPEEFKRLTACIMYLPLARLKNSPYADLSSPSLHFDLEPLFAKEFCASLGMSRQVPLRVVGDIGGGGALARIEKGRKVMRERKSEWSQTDELPIEIPLPPENRYHSIFACPVSKEQSTEQNPPMMMTCGHVITKDSLQKLSKSGGRVKCPYCPAESQLRTVARPRGPHAVVPSAATERPQIFMSHFRPTRASPPVKPVSLAHVSEASRSSATSIPEFAGLTSEDVDFLDAVIQRAGLAATTFLTVFKAYNDELHERDLDPQNEVVYYGKLLKIGTLKGKNWGDKWTQIKLQQGYGISNVRSEKVVKSHKQPSTAAIPKRLKPSVTPSSVEDDVFTINSHRDDDRTELSSDAGTDAPQYHGTPQRLFPRRTPSPSELSSVNIIDPGRSSSPSPLPRHRSVIPLHRRNIPNWNSNASDITESNLDSPSTIPPSYRAAVQDTNTPKPSLSQRISPTRNAPTTPSIASSAQARNIVAQARERRGSVINENDAWNKIRMSQDEKEADKFRDERLLERCWDVWRQGLHWIVTTNEQISQARDTLLLRLSLQRWQNLTASRMELCERVSTLANNRRLRAALRIWHAKLKNKRQIEWQKEMRLKMHHIREKRDAKLLKDSWTKWQQAHWSHISEQYYTEHLITRFFQRWREKVFKVDRLEDLVQEFFQLRKKRSLKRAWSRMKTALQIKNAERAVVERVCLRVMSDVMDVWHKHAHDNHIADTFYDKLVQRRAFRLWISSRSQMQSLESKAVKHLARQDSLLLRAVARVWKARVRGQLLQRVNSVRLMKNTLSVWKERIHQQRRQEDLALAFSLRSNSYTAASTLKTWHQAYTTHVNAHSFAIHYHTSQLQYKMLLTWRIQLRAKFKLVKQARMAEKYFVVRKAWNVWKNRLEESRRTKKLNDFLQRKLRNAFTVWIKRVQREKQRRLAEEDIQIRIAKRIMRSTLSRWTNRVIELKLRKIEVVQRNETSLVMFAFKKWKALCIRHVEELSLMESYQDVKREENIRRMFHRWLSAARASRHRRVTLQQREDRMKHASTSAAWGKWRDRFINEKLRPVEKAVGIQSQRNLLFRAFGIWHSKTKSLPAIRFHASHTKANYWRIWRSAMPQALQAKEAREMERRAVLSRALEKWVQTYRTKIALKAVARARYLRLPTSAPRQTTKSPRSGLAPEMPATRNVFPRRNARAESVTATDTEETDAGPSRPVVRSRPFGARTGIASLLASKPQAEASPRPKFSSRSTRDPSPTPSKSSLGGTRNTSPTRSSYNRVRSKTTLSYKPQSTRGPSPSRTSRPPSPSSVGGDAVGRSKLWMEIRDMQRRSRPPTEHSEPRS